MAAGAGIHGAHQLEAGGEVHLAGGPADGDVAGLQRFSQGVEHLALKFGELVEKQHSVVGQGDFPWPRVAAAVIYGNKCNTVGLKPTNEYRSYTNYCDKNLMIKCNEERYAYK
ncbi:hypothetical protein D3C84_393190 [compost metagenome]